MLVKHFLELAVSKFKAFEDNLFTCVYIFEIISCPPCCNASMIPTQMMCFILIVCVSASNNQTESILI